MGRSGVGFGILRRDVWGLHVLVLIPTPCSFVMQLVLKS